MNSDHDEKESAGAKYHELKSGNPVWNAVKGVVLAKAPLEGAPLVYGGHRVADEPREQGIFGVLSKYAYFFGPGMIITVAFIDPDNFQSAVQDGQDFGYKLLDMVLISVLIAVYLQVRICVDAPSILLLRSVSADSS